MAKNPALRAVSGGSAKAANRGGPFPGGKAPAFRWPRDGGGTVGLADFARRKQPMAYGQQKTLYGRKFMGTVRAQAAIWRRFGPKCLLPATRKTCSTQRSRCEPPAGYKSLTQAHKMPLKPVSVATDRENSHLRVFRTSPNAASGRGRPAKRRIARTCLRREP